MISTPKVTHNVRIAFIFYIGYYFKVTNTFKNKKIKFNILNLSKPASLYNKGMKVLIHSRSKVFNEEVGWYRGCSAINYEKNNYRKVGL